MSATSTASAAVSGSGKVSTDGASGAAGGGSGGEVRTLKVFVPNQTGGGETRVALIPAAVKKLITPKLTVGIEAGAGLGASHRDDAYLVAGATVNGPDGWSTADIVLTVHAPSMEQVALLKPGAIVMGMLSPFTKLELVKTMAARGVSAMALELLPRITRAQAMDTLSSQANISGYKAVIMAAERSPRIFPMLMTAAGTLQPAKVFVIGAGVAGLQAIATAKRLGAVVTAYDVRPAVKEQVQSVGAKFLELPMETTGAQDQGGYAKEQTPEQQAKQRALMARAVIDSDVVITTAAIPGKPAPKLIPTAVVDQMSAGSVIVDLASETGGNCECTEPGKVIVRNGVTIIGTANIPGTVPFHASQVYSTNLVNLLKVIIAKDGSVKVDLTDEVLAGVTLCHDGQITHPKLKEAVNHE